jgi:hypothetical protein
MPPASAPSMHARVRMRAYAHTHLRICASPRTHPRHTHALHTLSERSESLEIWSALFEAFCAARTILIFFRALASITCHAPPPRPARWLAQPHAKPSRIVRGAGVCHCQAVSAKRPFLKGLFACACAALRKLCSVLQTCCSVLCAPNVLLCAPNVLLCAPLLHCANCALCSVLHSTNPRGAPAHSTAVV